MNPKFFVIVFTILIFSVMGFVSWNVFQEKMGFNKDYAVAYFYYEEELKAVKKELISGQDSLKESLRMLFSGPSPEEERRGYFTVLPERLRLEGYVVEGKTAVLRINDGFRNFGGGASMIRAALAQIVFTATEQQGVDKLAFEVKGRRDTLIIGGEGYMINKPLSREDVRF